MAAPRAAAMAAGTPRRSEAPQLADGQLGLGGLLRRPREPARLDRVLDDAFGGARDVVGAGVRAGGDGLGHPSAFEQQPGAVVRAPAARDDLTADGLEEHRSALRLAVVVDAARAGKETEPLVDRGMADRLADPVLEPAHRAGAQSGEDDPALPGLAQDLRQA